MKVRWQSAAANPGQACRRASTSAASARVTLRCEAMAALSISATMAAAASMDRSMCSAMWPMTCGSTASCRSAKCLTSTALSRASSGGEMATRGSARRRERRSGRAHVELARRRARGEQHRHLVLAHQVQQMEQGALVADAGVQVLDQQRAARRHATSASPSAPASSRAAPDFRRQTLARCVLPAPGGATTTTEACGQSRPAVDDVGGRLVGPADEEILRPQRRPVRRDRGRADPARRHGLSLAAGSASPSVVRRCPCRRSCRGRRCTAKRTSTPMAAASGTATSVPTRPNR